MERSTAMAIEVSSHYSAATAVLRGAADVAIGNEKTCRMMEGTGFYPSETGRL